MKRIAVGKSKGFVLIVALLCIVLTFEQQSWAMSQMDVQSKEGGKSFFDVKEQDWFYEPVKALATEGILIGYPDGSFKPEAVVTFGEFIKMMMKAIETEQSLTAQSSIEKAIAIKLASNWSDPYYEKGLEKGLYTRWDIKLEDLKKPIARKYMALMVGSFQLAQPPTKDNQNDIAVVSTIEEQDSTENNIWRAQKMKQLEAFDYDRTLVAISDIKTGDLYEYEMLQAYRLGILKGYPDSTFGPNRTLTRAEAALVIWRYKELLASGLIMADQQRQAGNQAEQKAIELQNQEQTLTDVSLLGLTTRDAYWAKDPNYKEMEDWYNGSNLTTHSISNYWLGNHSYKPQLRGQFLLKNGKLIMLDSVALGSLSEAVKGIQDQQDGWCMAGKTYITVNEDIYKVLKAYCEYARKEDYFVSISGGRGEGFDSIGIYLSEKDGPNFPKTCSISFNDGIAPAVVFDMGMNYKMAQLAALVAVPAWQDDFLYKGRILEPSLIELNRRILTEIYGVDTGTGIFEMAISKYKVLYVKDPNRVYLNIQNLPNEIRNIGGMTVNFNDDETSRITLYISRK